MRHLRASPPGTTVDHPGLENVMLATRSEEFRATLPSMGERDRPRRLCISPPVSFRRQRRFGLSELRSAGSSSLCRYGTDPPHTSTEAAVRPPELELKNVCAIAFECSTTTPAVALTASLPLAVSEL
jgi:hypothetical protein